MDGVDLIGYAVGGVLLAVAGLAQWRKRLQPAREQVWFVIFAVVLLALSLSMPGGDNRLIAFIGLWAMWLVSQVRWSGWGVVLRLLMWVMRLFAVVVIADAVWHLGRPAWINPNISGAILVLGLPFGGGWLSVAALITTGSRGAILGLLLAAYLLWHKQIEAHRRSLVVIGAATLFVFLAVWRPGTIVSRLDHWAEALRLFAASPVIGWGPGSYVDVSRIPWQNHADNALLTLLAEQGLVGVLALAPLAVVVVLRWRTSTSPLVRLALLACLLQNVVDDTWLQPWPALLLGLNLAMLWRTDEVVEGSLADAYRAGGRGDALVPTVGAAVER